MIAYVSEAQPTLVTFPQIQIGDMWLTPNSAQVRVLLQRDPSVVFSADLAATGGGGGGGGAPSDAPYITTAPDPGLSNEVVLGLQVIMTGTLAARPAASINGRLYFVTDTGSTRWTRDTGSTWEDLLYDWTQILNRPSTFAPSAHHTSHEDGGSDEVSVVGLSGLLADPQKVRISKNGSLVGTRKELNLVEGTNVTLTIADDAGNDRVNATITSAGGGGGSTPTGTGFVHVTSGVQDGAAKLVDTADINADQVTYAKIQNVSATDRLLGRDTAGAGDIEELTASGGLEFNGGPGIQRSALTGDVTASAGSNTTTLANIPNDVPMAGDLLATAIAAPSTPAAGKGRIYVDSTSKNVAVKDDAGVVKHGVQTKASVASNFLTAINDAGSVSAAQPAFSDVSGSVAAGQMPALTGDVTTSAGSVATTIANDAVTYAKMQNVSAASKLLGRGDSGSGDPQEITLGSGLSMSGTTISASGGGGATVPYNRVSLPVTAINNVSTKQTMYTFNVSANDLSTNKTMSVVCTGDCQINSGSCTLTFEIKFGATVLWSDVTSTIGLSGTTRRPFKFTFEITNQGATNVQGFTGQVVMGNTTAATTGQGDIAADARLFDTPIGFQTLGAEDTTATKAVTISVTISVANAANEIRVLNGYALLI